MADLAGDESHLEEDFSIHMSEGMVALASYRPKDACRRGLRALELETQGPNPCDVGTHGSDLDG